MGANGYCPHQIQVDPDFLTKDGVDPTLNISETDLEVTDH